STATCPSSVGLANQAPHRRIGVLGLSADRQQGYKYRGYSRCTFTQQDKPPDPKYHQGQKALLLLFSAPIPKRYYSLEHRDAPLCSQAVHKSHPHPRQTHLRIALKWSAPSALSHSRSPKSP